MALSRKDLDLKIENLKQNKEPSRLIIGYKTYSKLVKEEKFLDQITNNSDDPLTKYYKGIKIKIVTEKHFFEIE